MIDESLGAILLRLTMGGSVEWLVERGTARQGKIGKGVNQCDATVMVPH